MTAGPAEAEAGPSTTAGIILRSGQESIDGLRELARLARHVLGGDPERQGAFAFAFAAQCTGCGLRIDGAELLQVTADSAPDAPVDSKIDRLRKGWCARRTCESRFYEIRCIAQRGVDWPSILAMKDGYISAPETLASNDPLFSASFLSKKLIFAGGLVLAFLLLLALGFQYWAGGTIPFLREPEKFEIDPAAAQWYNDLKEAAAAEN